MTGSPRETATADILGALIVISRRGVADARTANLSLSMTDQSILGFIVDHPGCRSVDIAQAYRLNRSTVSRQLAGLMALGVVRESTDAAGRGRPLELTETGRAAYDEAIGILHGIVSSQLDGWSDAEVARFARDLQRFNVGRASETRPRHPIDDPDGSPENAPQGTPEEKEQQ
ncbi:DNA-binding transcriptional regulator, MarR family [Agromyces sp. CF514]|uniref:MarR family winged helix-turn-helix transcriptional regulator n=1 Tax=Agromyces sp. CF514 TaxID=1881031 RepID=UPI0008EF988E|nr:MarR family winged helix-turn-helix transcriptional regulator [Agromyces sp. CF514]SFR83808.1 DNA-binding transcriptional regulator, MarR family [Agromyces sp. CF514]